MKFFMLLCFVMFLNVFSGDYIDDDQEKENQIREIVKWLYDIEDDEINIDLSDDMGGINTDDFNLSPTIRWLIKKDLNPNVEDNDGNTLLHHLIKINNKGDYTAEIKRLFIYGANPYIKNKGEKTAYKLAPEKTIFGKWDKIDGDESKKWKRLDPNSCTLPTFVRNHYRYGKKLKENDQIGNRILFLIVHGTGFFEGSGKNNADYYDEETRAFRGLMNFAKMYADAKNKKRVDKGKKSKILHLMSFMWNGHLFDLNRQGSGKKLARILRNWHYRDAHVVLVGHSHGNNVIDFALNELNQDYHDLLEEKNRKRGGKLKKGLAQLLFFLAPPCKQVFPTSTSKYLSVVAYPYNFVNDCFANEPVGYDQLIVAYSDNDWTAKAGSIDAGTAGLVFGAAITASVVTVKYRNEIKDTSKFLFETVKEKTGLSDFPINKVDTKTQVQGISAVTFLTYSYVMGGRTLISKVKFAHKYTNVMPVNKENKGEFVIKGPKAHAQILLNGKKIGHSCPELLENLGYVWESLVTQYPAHLACSSDFIVNINTDVTEENKKTDKGKKSLIQCFLPEMKKKGYTESFHGVDRNCNNKEQSLLLLNAYGERVAEKTNGNKDTYSALLDREDRKDGNPHRKNYSKFKKIYDKEIPVRILQ